MMDKFFDNFKTGLIVSACVCILIGVFLLVFPGITSVVMSYCLGVGIIAFGAVSIVSYFLGKNSGFLYHSNLALGLLLFVIGLLIVIRVDIFIFTIPYMFGLFIILNGILAIQNSMDLKRLEYGSWVGVLILAILTIILGVILLFNPFGAFFTTIIFISVSLIYHGISNLCVVYHVNKARKNMNSK